MDGNLSNKLKSLRNGKGLQYLLNEIERLLGNPVATFDLYYNLIAYTDGIVTDDPLWNELISTGCFGAETLKLFKEESWIDAVANSEVIAFMESDKLKYDRINAKIFDKDNIRIANLIVVACKRPFKESDPQLIVEISNVLAKEIQQSQFYQSLDHVYQETLICEMLNGKLIDKQLITAKMADIDKGLGQTLYLAVVKLPDDQLNRLGYFRDVFKQTQPEFKYYIYSDLIVILLGTEESQLCVDRNLKKLCAVFAKEGMVAGISGSFENPFRLGEHYWEAAHALESGLDSGEKRLFYLYKDIEELD